MLYGEAFFPQIGEGLLVRLGLNEQWDLAFEFYTLSQRNVLNQNNSEAQTIIANGGYPFTLANGFNFNAPNFAQCGAAQLSCTARVVATLAYLNYKVSPLEAPRFKAVNTFSKRFSAAGCTRMMLSCRPNGP
jgi:hypothetical protein